MKMMLQTIGLPLFLCQARQFRVQSRSLRSVPMVQSPRFYAPNVPADAESGAGSALHKRKHVDSSPSTLSSPLLLSPNPAAAKQKPGTPCSYNSFRLTDLP